MGLVTMLTSYAHGRITCPSMVKTTRVNNTTINIPKEMNAMLIVKDVPVVLVLKQ